MSCILRSDAVHSLCARCQCAPSRLPGAVSHGQDRQTARVTGLRERLALVPLRVRLVAAVLLLSALGLLVTAFAATSALRTYLEDRVDKGLQTNGLAFADDLLRGQYGPGRPSGRRAPLDRYFVQVVGADGTVLDNGGGAGSEPDLAPPTDARPTGSRYLSTVPTVEGDGSWRVLTDVRGDSTVRVAASLDDTDRTVARLLGIEAVLSLIVLALLAGAAYAVVRSSLRPLREVEQTAGAIAGGDLSRRVPRSDDRTEVGRLAMAFNAMLGHIGRAFSDQRASEEAARRSEEAARRSEEAARQSEVVARQSEAQLRRFVADASHELRTPLTSIRGFAELYRQGAVPPGPDLDRVMGRVEGEATRMGQLVEEMLLLARLDQQRPLERAPVDLLRLAADAVHDARGLDPARPITLEPGAGAPPVVRGDEAKLRQVLVNLLGNALAHTPAGSPVALRLSTTGPVALVEVVDSGPGLTAEQAARVFERFYRVDTARTRASGGSGLGLSIVQAVVEAHGGRVGVRSTPGGGATFLVELPLAG